MRWFLHYPSELYQYFLGLEALQYIEEFDSVDECIARASALGGEGFQNYEIQSSDGKFSFDERNIERLEQAINQLDHLLQPSSSH